MAHPPQHRGDRWHAEHPAQGQPALEELLLIPTALGSDSGGIPYLPYADTEAMTKHLDEISANVAPGSHALVVADRAGWHGSGELTVPDNITLLPLPSAAPELNPQENVWEWLRKNKLALRVFDSYDDIVEACCQAWNDFIADPATVASVTRRDWAKAVKT